MWDEEKQQQLNALRLREEQGVLTPSEAQQLDGLLLEIDREESAALSRAIERLRQEQGRLEEDLANAQSHNAHLAAIAARYADLLDRARDQLSELIAGHEALRAEYERVARS